MKRPVIDPEQCSLFRRAMADVTPLGKPDQTRVQQRNERRTEQLTSTRQPQEIDDYGQHLQDTINAVEHAVSAAEPLFFAQAGILPKTLRQLKRGELLINARLDLHGLTIAQARAALSKFMYQSSRNKHRIVSIVHGKGSRSQTQYPILKNLTNIWLRQFKQVLAFCSAQPKDGGTGAVHVLLKKP